MKESVPRSAFAVRWGGATHPGRHRAENEDSFLATPPVFLVADGMGGHLRGKEASAEVTGAFEQVSRDEWFTVEALDEATSSAFERVGPLADVAHDAPGSTVSGVGMTLHGGLPAWLVFNIGDSRTYLMQGGKLEQVTVDHSQVQELIDSGVPEETARKRVHRNVITRAIGGGMRTRPRADQWLLPARPGDRILICSDGLSEELTSQVMCRILTSFANADDAAQSLVAAAVGAGGRDNVTAVVVDAVSVDGETTRRTTDDDTVRLSAAVVDPTVPDLPVSASRVVGAPISPEGIA